MCGRSISELPREASGVARGTVCRERQGRMTDLAGAPQTVWRQKAQEEKQRRKHRGRVEMEGQNVHVKLLLAELSIQTLFNRIEATNGFVLCLPT